MRQLAPLLSVASFASLTLAGSAFATPPAAAGGVTVSEVATFHYAAPLGAPRTVRLESTSGDITATPSTDGKLDVRAVASGSGDLGRVRVITREEAGGVVVCVLFADESPDMCRMSGVNHSGSDHNHQNVPSVQLLAHVPAGVSLTAATLNGSIRAHGITGEVRATTLNGNVEVSATAIAAATTLSGNVDATFDTAPTKSVEVSTNNGDVKVKLPASVDAEVAASTMNGTIKTSFAMPLETTPGGYGPKSGHARLGKGGPKLDAHTLNGDVDVKSGG